MKNSERFLEIYRENLRYYVKQDPEFYAWPESEFDVVFERMSKAILKGTFNKATPAFKDTCRDLGLKHTYAAIREFIEG